MSQKSFTYIASAFLLALAIGSFGIPHTASAYVIGLQFKDDHGTSDSTGGTTPTPSSPGSTSGCNAGLGTAGTVALNGASGWIGDSDLSDPNCARVAAGTDTIPVGTDFRICIQAEDHAGAGGDQLGTVQCSGWASQSSWSGSITDNDSWDPDAYKVTVQTQSIPAPTNRQITDYSFGLRVGDNTNSIYGDGACNSWTQGNGVTSVNKASGGGWSNWGNAGLGTNFNCLQVIAYSAVTTISSPSSGTLSASPTSLPSGGGNVTFTWTSTNTTGGGVTLWNVTDNVMIGTTPNIANSGSKVVSVTGTGTKQFRLDTWNAASQAGSSASASVTIAAAAAPTVTLSTSKNSGSYSNVSSINITTGDTIGLQWSSTNATSCSGTASPSDSAFAASGTSGTDTTVTEPTSNSSRTYTVTCTGTGGSGSDSVTITNAPAPTVTLSTSKNSGSYSNVSSLSITTGDTVGLQWSSTNATSCSGTASPSDSSFAASGTSGTDTTVTEPTSGNSRTYTVTCTGTGGSASDSVTVTNAAASCTLDGNTVTSGNSDTFYNTTSVPFGQSCDTFPTYAQTRTCTNGTFSGSSSYSHASCSTAAPSSCTLDGVIVPHNGSYEFYSQDPLPTGTICGAGQSSYVQTRTCNNGTLSGNSSYSHSDCNVTPPSATQSDITLSANNTLVRQGGSVLLTWDGGNSTACTVTGTNGFSSSALTGTSVSSGAISQKAVFTLSCTLGSSRKTANITVNVTPQVQEI